MSDDELEELLAFDREPELAPPDPLVALWTDLSSARDPLARARLLADDTLVVPFLNRARWPWSELSDETRQRFQSQLRVGPDGTPIATVAADANPVLALVRGLSLVAGVAASGERQRLNAQHGAAEFGSMALEIAMGADTDPALVAEAHRLAAGFLRAGPAHIGKIEWVPNGPAFTSVFWPLRAKVNADAVRARDAKDAAQAAREAEEEEWISTSLSTIQQSREYPDPSVWEEVSDDALLHLQPSDEPPRTVEAWGLRVDQPLPEDDELSLGLTDILGGTAVLKRVFAGSEEVTGGPAGPDAATFGRGTAIGLPLFADAETCALIGPDGRSWAELARGPFGVLGDVRMYSVDGSELFDVPICVEGAFRCEYLGADAVLLSGWHGQLEAFAISGGAGAHLADSATRDRLHWDDGWTTGRKHPMKLFISASEGQAIVVWCDDRVFSLRHGECSAEAPPTIRYVFDAPLSAVGWSGADWYGANLEESEARVDVVHGRGDALIGRMKCRIITGVSPVGSGLVPLAPGLWLAPKERTIWNTGQPAPDPASELLGGWRIRNAPDGTRALVAPDGSERDITRYTTPDPLAIAFGECGTRLHALDRGLGLVVIEASTGAVIERRIGSRDWRPPRQPPGRWTASRCAQHVALTRDEITYTVGIRIGDASQPDRHWCVGWAGAEHVHAVDVATDGTLVAATPRHIVRLPLGDLLH